MPLPYNLFTTMMTHPINQEEAAHGYIKPEGVTAIYPRVELSGTLG